MPEARRKPQQSGANYRATWSFGQLLEWHLDNGTRPGADCGVRWLRTKFAYEVGLTSDRALRFWLRDENLPDGLHLALIEQALFGRDTAAHPDLREELRRAHRRAKSVGQPARGVGGAAPLLPPDRRIGRDEQVAQLVSALTCNDPAACLVLGAPGIGKTTLTLRVATSGALIERFGARRWFVPLETASDAATLRTALTAAACLDLAHARFEDALLRLGEQPCLVILDNLETPWETEPQLVEGILRQVAAVPGGIARFNARRSDAARATLDFPAPSCATEDRSGARVVP